MSNTGGETLWVLLWLIAYLNLSAPSCSLDVVSGKTETVAKAALCNFIEEVEDKKGSWVDHCREYCLQNIHWLIGQMGKVSWWKLPGAVRFKRHWVKSPGCFLVALPGPHSGKQHCSLIGIIKDIGEKLKMVKHRVMFYSKNCHLWHLINTIIYHFHW